ncbi:MAG: hypothetical protein Kow0069_13660 [Promethearchaeota archaeon]
MPTAANKTDATVNLKNARIIGETSRTARSTNKNEAAHVVTSATNAAWWRGAISIPRDAHAEEHVRRVEVRAQQGVSVLVPPEVQRGP